MAINLSKLIRRASADFLVNVAVINSVTGDGFIDPNVEGSYTETAQTRHIEQGLLTYAADAKQQLRPPGESRQKQWMTQVMCDLVIDFMPEVDLSGDNVRFLVNGEEYAQKDTGNEITDFYTRAGNETLLRTVALFRTGRIEGRICYTSSSVQTDLYHYDLAAQKFSWANPTAPAGVATIGPGNDGNLIEFYVANADGSDSTLSMYVDPAGAVHAADMIATARSPMRQCRGSTSMWDRARSRRCARTACFTCETSRPPRTCRWDARMKWSSLRRWLPITSRRWEGR